MTFAGCSKGNDEPQAETPDTPDNPGDNEDNDDGSGTVKPGNGKILIAWFSRWGNTNYASDVDASTGASIIIDKGLYRPPRRVPATRFPGFGGIRSGQAEGEAAGKQRSGG